MKRTHYAGCVVAVVYGLFAGSVHAGITIQFDYSLDTGGFFTSQRKDVLAKAADVFEIFTDDLDAITPGSVGNITNTWTAKFTNPTSGIEELRVDLVVPADTLVIFAGARDLTGDTLGQGGPGGFSASGTQAFVDTAKARGELGALDATPTDFGPWGGSIAFDTIDNDTGLARNWNSDPVNGPGSMEDDLLSVAIHEMAHALGFGIVESWMTYVDDINDVFTGPASISANNNTAPGLEPINLSHWAEGFLDFTTGDEAAMDPSLLRGDRMLFTALDYAGLVDVGWQVPEPATLTLVGMGVVFVASRRRRTN